MITALEKLTDKLKTLKIKEKALKEKIKQQIVKDKVKTKAIKKKGGSEDIDDEKKKQDNVQEFNKLSSQVEQMVEFAKNYDKNGKNEQKRFYQFSPYNAMEFNEKLANTQRDLYNLKKDIKLTHEETEKFNTLYRNYLEASTYLIDKAANLYPRP